MLHGGAGIGVCGVVGAGLDALGEGVAAFGAHGPGALGGGGGHRDRFADLDQVVIGEVVVVDHLGPGGADLLRHRPLRIALLGDQEPHVRGLVGIDAVPLHRGLDRRLPLLLLPGRDIGRDTVFDLEQASVLVDFDRHCGLHPSRVGGTISDRPSRKDDGSMKISIV
ncbi:hypothetical protein FFK22_002805 [Mycobacterium sp. KBS0706]|nr:hypothetical protein FFK22_002805 [Mycobacterium sp. KBS0706]